MAATIEIEDTITVGTLADKLMIPVSQLIAELMKNGVMVTVNERIDFDTAQIIVEELGLDVTLQKHVASARETIAERVSPVVVSDSAQPRPPVVAVMGHVDHGKTTLLDTIRGAHVAKNEAGGITQHISAYEVEHHGRKIVFLDTPGHEAFAAIRERGAHLTDIALIVVAADDGIKPQTIEAIRFARKAGSKIIVAINKIDKEGADSNRIKQQLADQNLLVEEWGGDTIVVEVSGKEGKGINALLDMILLVADVDELRADAKGLAAGLIIEAHVEQGRGSVAHALVESGTLHKGEFLVAGSTYAKVRSLESTDGVALAEATPSTPVAIIGFKELPEFGDEFTVVKNEKEARAIAEQEAHSKTITNSSRGMTSGELLRIMNRNRDISEFKMVVKADAQGSLTSVTDSLKALGTEEVAVRTVGSGIGSVNENDVYMAHTSHAIVYGFNVSISSTVKQLAARQKVAVRLFDVIYELIEDVRKELSALLTPEIVEIPLGRLVVRGVFKTTKTEIICGGEVTKGKLELPALAAIMRDDQKLAEVEVTNLKRGQADVKEVFEGQLCGLSLKTVQRLVMQEGDTLELFRRETRKRNL